MYFFLGNDKKFLLIIYMPIIVTKFERMVFNKVSDSLAHYKNKWL